VGVLQHTILWLRQINGKKWPHWKSAAIFICQKWVSNAIKMMIGIGTPRNNSKIERMVYLPD
jgi:hypothetical protein